MKNFPVRLFLSQNFLALNRRQKLYDFFQNNSFSFVEVSPPSSFSNLYANSTLRKKAINKAILNTDYFLVMSDRYEAYRDTVDLEISCAFFLDIPVVVIQPWSCWSIPENIKKYASIIIDWDNQQLISYLQKKQEEEKKRENRVLQSAG